MKGKIFLILVIAVLLFYRSMAQTSAIAPFFTKTLTKTKYGYITSMTTPDGKLFPCVSTEKIFFLFYINGKSYTEQEALQLDPTPFKTQKFNAVFAWDYEIEGRDLSPYIQILYVGDPPPLSDFTKKNLAVFNKYNSKTITGVVKGLAYFSQNKLLSGFILESGNQDFRVNITMNEVSRLMKAVAIGDIVIIEVGHASITRDSELPVLVPKTLTKDGEKLIQKGSVQI